MPPCKYTEINDAKHKHLMMQNTLKLFVYDRNVAQLFSESSVPVPSTCCSKSKQKHWYLLYMQDN